MPNTIKIDPITVKVKGAGGAGGSSIGEILARSAARAGYYIQCSRAFPAEIMGGTAWFQMKISAQPLGWWGGAPQLELNDARGGDWTVTLTLDDGASRLKADFSPLKIAKDDGNPRNANIVALGFLAGTLGLDLEIVSQAANQRYARRGGSIDSLHRLIGAGWQAALSGSGWRRWEVKPAAAGARRLIINGNEAIALGALAAGVRFFCGYPITPASSILELMLNELPKLGGTALQLEDEMSALAACIGASYAGTRAMAATSGPGFALMSELLNLAVMAEIPITVVDVQRSGPATGQPSKSEQADLLYALYGSPGDVQRIVIAPSTVEEALHMTAQAVNLAEHYQMPVILLSDAALSNRIQAIAEPDWDSIPRLGRTKPSSSGNGFERYLTSPTGISAMPIPGEDDFPYVASGMEHTAAGAPTGSLEDHYLMAEKRRLKLESARSALASEPGYDGLTPDCKVGVIGWGSTRGAIEEAVRRARLDGIKVAAAHVRYLNPLPEDRLADWMGGLNRVIVAEENRTGQLATVIRYLAPHKIESLLPEYDPHLTPEFILGRLTEGSDARRKIGGVKARIPVD